MSLINQMLKDLEGRKRHDSPRVALPASLRRQEKRHVWVFLLCGLLAGLGFYAYKNTSLLLFKRNIQATIQPLTGKIAKQKVFIDLKETAAQSDPVALALNLMQQTPVFEKKPEAVKPVMMISPVQNEVSKTPPPPSPPEKQTAKLEPLPSPPAANLNPAPRRPAKPMFDGNLPDAELEYRKGLNLYALGQFSHAADALEKSLKLDPGKKTARLLLIKAYIALGDWLEASEQFKAQAQLGFDSEVAKLHVQALMKQGMIEASEKVLTDALKIAGDDPDLRGLLGALRQRQGRYVEAVEVYRRLTRDDPAQAKWWLGLAIGLEAIEQFDQAIVAYRQVLSAGMPKSNQVSAYAETRIAALGAGR